jgi:hypothetical protein
VSEIKLRPIPDIDVFAHPAAALDIRAKRVEFTKSISGARPHPNPRCRDAIREQIAAP